MYKRGGSGVAIKGAKSIAEYAIRKWLKQEDFALECFSLEFYQNEAVLTDCNGARLRLVYDPDYRIVIPKEM